MASSSKSEKTHNKNEDYIKQLNQRILENQDAYESFLQIDSFLKENNPSQSDCFSEELPELSFNPFFDEDPDISVLYSVEGDKI